MRRGAPCALGDRSSAGRMVALLAAGSGYPRNSARKQKEAVAVARARFLPSRVVLERVRALASCGLDQREEFFFNAAQGWKQSSADPWTRTLTPRRRRGGLASCPPTPRLRRGGNAAV